MWAAGIWSGTADETSFSPQCRASPHGGWWQARRRKRSGESPGDKQAVGRTSPPRDASRSESHARTPGHSGAGRSPGWPVCERLIALAPDGPPSHALRAQWHRRTVRTDLPLRGQRRPCRATCTRRTGFPFHPRRQTGAADTCCGRVYRSAVTDGLRFPGLLYSSALRIQPKTPDRYP